MDENEKDQLMTVAELAAYLKVAEITIYTRTRKGQAFIPHIRVGNGIRFEKRAVIEFFKNEPTATKI